MNGLTSILRRYRTRNLHILVGSAHKVGSTWVNGVLKDTLDLATPVIPDAFRNNPALKYTINLNKPGSLDFIEKFPGRAIFKSHSYPPGSLANKTNPIIVTVIRDPRDLMVSSVFYLSHLDPQKGGWGNSFRELSDEDRFFLWLDKNDLDFKLLGSWNSYPDCWVFRNEDLLVNPEKEMIRFFSQYNIPYSEMRLKKALNLNSFETQTGRANGVEDPDSFFRKGIAGDWKDYFTPEIKLKFKSTRKGLFSDLLIELGYETGKDW